MNYSFYPSNSFKTYAFIDESLRDNTHYFVGAVIATQSQIDKITAGMDKLMLDYSHQFSVLSPTTEFHGSAIMRGTGVWKKIPLRLKFALFRKVFTYLQETDARISVQGIHYAQLWGRANERFPPRERALSHLFEQINHYGFPENPVHVIADEHHTAATSRSNFARYKLYGTYGGTPSKLQNIDKLDFRSSESTRMLQAADMVTYIYNRLQTIQENNPRAHQEKVKLWKILEGQGEGRIWPPPK